MEIHPGKGVLKKREVSKHQETPSPVSLCLGTSEGNITGRKNKQLKPTDYVPNGNSQWRSSADISICH